MVLINFLNQYSAAISAISIIIAGFWALLKFREYLKDKRFNTYHKLINDLVNEQAQPGNVLKVDRQIAIIFELRNFPSYYPVSRRMLTDLRILWAEHTRVVKEIDLTLKFISKNWIGRNWNKFWKVF